MSSLSNRLTLLEAAQILGVSSQTVRRLIHKGKLAATQSEGPHGQRWEIERLELLRHLAEGSEGQQLLQEPPQPQHEGVHSFVGVRETTHPITAGVVGVGGVSSFLEGFSLQAEMVSGAGRAVIPGMEANVEVNRQTPTACSEPQHREVKPEGVQFERNVAPTGFFSAVGVNVGVQQSPDQAGSTASVPLDAHLAALQMAERQLNLAQQQLEEERVKRERAQEKAAQEERVRLSLEFQLQKYQMALSEQADSLAEVRALKMAAESRLLEVERIEAPDLPQAELRIAMPVRRGWAQRLRSWFGGSAQAQ